MYDNYSKFITATDTIRRMKANVEEMGGRMDELQVGNNQPHNLLIFSEFEMCRDVSRLKRSHSRCDFARPLYAVNRDGYSSSKRHGEHKAVEAQDAD